MNAYVVIVRNAVGNEREIHVSATSDRGASNAALKAAGVGWWVVHVR
jgi:hypothetical protein